VLTYYFEEQARKFNTGYGLRFDGSNDYVRLPTTSRIGGDLFIEAVVKVQVKLAFLRTPFTPRRTMRVVLLLTLHPSQ
jgi:hypothetical protein